MYLDSDVVRTVPTESVPQHLVNGLGNAVEHNVNHRWCGARAVLARFGVRRSVPQGKDQEILHAVHRREIVLVVENVRNGRRRRVVHHQAAVHGGAQGLAVDGSQVERLEVARRRWRGATHLPELEVEARRLGRIGARKDERRGTLEVEARDKERFTRVLQGQQPSVLLPLEHLLQHAVHATGGDFPAPAEHASGFELIEFGVPLWDDTDGFSGGVHRPAEGVAGGDHGGEDGANASAGDDVEEIRDLCLGIGGVETDLILEVDESFAGDNGGGPSAVNAENAGFVVGFTMWEPFVFEFGEDL